MSYCFASGLAAIRIHSSAAYAVFGNDGLSKMIVVI